MKLKFISKTSIYLGLFLLSLTKVYSLYFTFKPIDIPIRFNSNFEFGKEFKVKHTTQYELYVSVDRVVDSKYSECLLTGYAGDSTCNIRFDDFNLQWSIKSANVKPVVQKEIGFRQAHSWSKESVSRLIGSIYLETDRQYEFLFKVLSNYEPINQFNPKLVLVTNSAYFKNQIVYLIFFENLSVFLIIIGSLLYLFIKIKDR